MRSDAEKQFYTDNMLTGRFSPAFINSLNPGQLAMISSCMYYESELQKGIARGEKWVYTNSERYANQASAFDAMVASGRHGVNCAMPSGWAMIDMGVLASGMRYWGNDKGEIANYSTYAPLLLQACKVKHWEGGVPFSSLYEGGYARPGDTFMGRGHTFVYLGEDRVMAAGHDGKWHSDPDARTEDGRKAVFDTWLCPVRENNDYRFRVTWQMSFRDDFVPKYYRNSRGELVPNPAAN